MSSKIQPLKVGDKSKKSVVVLRHFPLVKPNEVREPSLNNHILLFTIFFYVKLQSTLSLVDFFVRDRGIWADSGNLDGPYTPPRARNAQKRSLELPRAPPDLPRPPQRLVAPSGARYPSEFNGFCLIWWLHPLCKLQWEREKFSKKSKFQILIPRSSEGR